MYNKRNGNIELLRFMFAVFVVLHHAILPIFKGGWLGVEFFFIITGFFMAKKLDNDKEKQAGEPIHTTVMAACNFIWKRLVSVQPYVIVSIVLGFLVRILFGVIEISAKNVLLFLLQFPYELFFLQNYGFASASYTGTTWYLSAMFFSLWLLYPIIRRYYDVYVGYAAPVITLLLSGYLVRTFGCLGSACDWLPGGLNSGFLRAVSEMSWGAFLYNVSIALSKGRFSREIKCWLAILEVGCYAVVFGYMFIWRQSIGQYDPVAVLIMSVGIVITLSGTSAFYGKFDYKLTYFAGKLSMVLFLNHGYWLFNILEIAKRISIQTTEINLKILGILLSFVTTFTAWFAGNYLRKIGGKVTDYFCNIFR